MERQEDEARLAAGRPGGFAEYRVLLGQVSPTTLSADRFSAMSCSRTSQPHTLQPNPDPCDLLGSIQESAEQQSSLWRRLDGSHGQEAGSVLSLLLKEACKEGAGGASPDFTRLLTLLPQPGPSTLKLKPY